MTSEVKTIEHKKQDFQENDKKNAKATTLKKFKFREWIEDMKHEIKTINWTTPEELRVYTQIVVGAVFFFGMGVYLVDLVLHGTLNLLTVISQWLVG